MMRTGILFIGFVVLSLNAYAEENLVDFLQKKRIELQKKEHELEVKEKRLEELKATVSKKISHYEEVLFQIERILARMEEIQNEKLDHIVKVYEKMKPDEAAERIVTLDDKTAVKILSRMKERKAGAIIARIKPQKAAVLTKKITDVIRNNDTR